MRDAQSRGSRLRRFLYALNPPIAQYADALEEELTKTESERDEWRRLALAWQQLADAAPPGSWNRLLEEELAALQGIEWLARDFVWSCPNPPDHKTYHALAAWFETETDEPERGRPGPKSVSVTLAPTEHKDNGAASAMSPERRDALSAKDSPPGTDSGSQSGPIGSPE